MICDNCGHINPNINKTCDNCGKKLEPAPRYPTKSNSSTTRTHEKNEGLFDDIKNLSTEKKIIGVCCLLLVLIFAVSSVLPYNNDTNIIPYENNTTDNTTDINNTPEVIQTPSKINTNINVTAKSPVISGESTVIKGYLLDESDNPLSNCEITVKIANNEFNVRTKHDGSYTLEYNDTENGSQNVSVVFDESDDYYGCYNNTFFEVVNNTTNEDGNSNTTQSENNHTKNNTTEKTNDNHDIRNSIFSWLFDRNDKKDNLTDENVTANNTTAQVKQENNNTTTRHDDNQSINNTTTHNSSRNNTTINNTPDENKSLNDTHNNITNNDTNNTHPDKEDKNNTTSDDKKDKDNHTENNTPTTNNTTNNTHNSTNTTSNDEKKDTKLDVNLDNNIVENEKTVINGTLVDEDNKPISNAIVKIKIEDKEFMVHTDSNGEYSIDYMPTDNESKNIEVIYEGDEKHQSTHKSARMSIK